jgi:tetratricopeptide (TPR) repeat protein
MFWGDQPEDRAKHSLSTVLSTLRAALGRSAIAARREHIELSPDLRLAVDALEFRAACEMGDDERAATLYRGPLLDDVVAYDAPGFELWLNRERTRMAAAFVGVCERRVRTLMDRQHWTEAADLASRWLAAAPSSPAAFVALLRARSGPGTSTALRTALSDYDHWTARIADEHGLATDAAVHALARDLATALASLERTDDVSTAPIPAPTVVAPGPSPDQTGFKQLPPVAYPAERPRAPRLWKRIAVAASVVAAGVATIAFARSRDAAAAQESGRPIVAVVQIENLRRDTSLAWVQQGLPQLITDALSQAPLLDPVAPVRVRDVLARRDEGSAALTAPQVLDVARRVGATWALRGGVTFGHGVYVLDLEARAVGNGAEVAAFSVSSSDPVQLGELAAGRLIQIASSSGTVAGSAPRYAAGSANPEAYRHFVLGLRAADERRAPDDERELDAAIALDSGFVDALLARRDIAVMRGESIASRLDSLIARHADRMSEWDRLATETWRALYAGEADRAEALAARLVARFPKDPRAYAIRAEVLATHGHWLATDSVYQRALALDSLAIAAGDGPCAPCTAYIGLVSTRLFGDDLSGAEQAARRWVRLQPNVPAAWSMLSSALAYAGHTEEAVDAARRAAALSRDEERLADLGRAFIVDRRFASADSIARLLRDFGTAEGRSAATDIEATLAREEGQFRRAAALLSADGGLELVQADNLVRLGRVHDAIEIYEKSGHSHAPRDAQRLSAEQARAFAWAHALEADALWRAGETSRLEALADSVRWIGARSYYGRDWGLYHHIAGLVALTHADTARAERELLAARWGVAGWTESLLIVGRIRLARGDATGAVTILRDAYKGPLDAMGRYVPRSELDAWMARAFARAGQTDSARVYSGRARPS